MAGTHPGRRLFAGYSGIDDGSNERTGRGANSGISRIVILTANPVVASHALSALIQERIATVYARGSTGAADANCDGEVSARVHKQSTREAPSAAVIRRASTAGSVGTARRRPRP